jgi:transposase
MLKEDRKTLRELAHTCKNWKERERLRALYALSIGQPIDIVCSIFCVDESTVHRWIKKWKSERNLSDESKSGRPPSFTEEEKKELKQLVDENNPQKYGLNASFWDCKELQDYFSMNGKSVSQETIRRYLKKTGARYIKAELHYSEADKKRQEEFALRFFRDIKSKPHSVVVLFQDEMSACCSPRKGYGWTFEKRLVIKVSQKGGRKRLNCFGAVAPLQGELVEMSSSGSKAGVFVKFLKKVRKKFKGKRIWLYLDNSRVHKSKKVQEFLKKQNKMELRFLPPYSPDLNLQEKWHGFKREKLLNNKSFESTHHLALAMHRFARNTPPEQIMSVCSLALLEKLIQ